MRNRFIQGSWDGVYILYCQAAIDWCYSCYPCAYNGAEILCAAATRAKCRRRMIQGFPTNEFQSHFFSVAVGLNGIDLATQIQEKASFLIICVLIDW